MVLGVSRGDQVPQVVTARSVVEPLENRTLLSVGTLDPTFGDNGVVIGDELMYLSEVVRHTNGTFLALGSVNDEEALIRFNRDGSLDETFGAGGILGLEDGGNLEAKGLATGDDGEIFILANRFELGTSGSQTIVMRLDADGEFHDDFGVNGVATVTLPNGTVSLLTDIEESGNQPLIAGCIATGGKDGSDSFVAKLTLDGELDSNFGSGGVVRRDLGEDDLTSHLAFDGRNSVIVSGREANGENVLYRLSATNGATDESFGTKREFGGQVSFVGSDFLVNTGTRLTRFSREGKIVKRFGNDGSFEIGGSGEGITAVTVENVDGYNSWIYVATINDVGNAEEIGVRRLTLDGHLDRSFGNDGLALTNAGQPNAAELAALGLFIDSAGGLLAIGRYIDELGGFASSAVARFQVSGSLDPTFGTSGVFIGNSLREVVDVEMQADGKIIVVGSAWDREFAEGVDRTSDIWIARYNADGSLDTTFSGDGEIIVSPGTGSGVGRKVALQADGKIVVLGNDSILYRFTASGALDNTFDNNGRQTLGIIGRSIAIQSSGRIIVGGTDVGDEDHYALQRYLPNGSLDLTFGDNGTIISEFDIPHRGMQIKTITLTPEGQILAGGVFWNTESINSICVVRYNADGSVDTTFGTDGLSVDIHDTSLKSVVVGPDGQVVLGGLMTYIGSRYYATFDGGEALETPFGISQGAANSVTFLDDGSILVGGFVATNEDMPRDFALLRYLPDGRLDTTFAENGMARVNLDGVSPYFHSGDEIRDLVVLGDGSVIAFGVSDHRLAMARFTLEPRVPQPTFAELRSDGTLVVHGTAGNDDILIGESRLFPNYVTVSLNGQRMSFLGEDVSSIRAYGFEGNDDITVGLNLETYVIGGDGDDWIGGGDGADRMKGQNGNDTLLGGDGNDSLYGDAGNDKLYGDDDDDYLHGGDGDDILRAGTGTDILYGRAGNDRFYTIGSIAQVFGGGGNDSADSDEDDILQSIAEMIA